MMRGTVGDFPLSVHYGVSSNAFINTLAQNPLYALQAAIEARQRDDRDPDYSALSGYGDNIRAAFADYLNVDIKEIPQENPEDSLMMRIPYNKEIEALKPNVIFIVMESFGTDLLKYNSASFDVLGELKKHFDQDYVFYNFLPAYSSTVGSMEAVISNIARRQGSVFLSLSPYADKKYKFSGPRPYKAAAFQTFFVYGGNSSWRNSASFMRNLGFDYAIGSDGMNGKNYPENEWGVFDEYLFDYVYEILESGGGQKFIFVLTTTNHPPYSLPQNYKPLPLDIPSTLDEKIIGRSLAKARFAAYQYSNRALGKFIDKIKSQPLGRKTIIAVTGDHNFKNIYGYLKEETFDSIRVPFYLYIPPSLRKGRVDTKVFGSHLDVLPTLYNLSLSGGEFWAMGTDLLSPKAQKNIAVHIDIIMNKDFAVIYNFDLPPEFYLWDRKVLGRIVSSDRTKEHERLIKHFLSMNAVSDYILKKTGKSLH